MIAFYRLITSFACFLCAAVAYGQLNSGNLTQYTEKDGLPGVQVSSLLVDRFGYIWAGTINGLVRYDGYEFKRFYSDPNDSTAIRGLPVYAMFEAHDGSIWIGSGPSFLNMYDPIYKTFKHYDFASLVDHPANVELDIVSMCEDHNGRIYFGISTYGGEVITNALLYKDQTDEQLKVFHTPDSLKIRNVLSLGTDPSGNVICTSFSGAIKIDPAGKLIGRTGLSLGMELMAHNDVPTDFKFDKRGHIWLITANDRLYDVDPATDDYKTWTPTINPALRNTNMRKAIAIDKNDNVWLATDDGIRFFNTKTNQFSSFNNGTKKELEHVQAVELRFDSFGTLWIGTNAEGLIKYENRPQLKSYVFNKADKNSITPGWANSICETNDGKLWIATNGYPTSGIDMLDVRTGQLVPMNFSDLSINNNNGYSIWQKAPGEIYLGTFQRTYALSIDTRTTHPVTLPGVPASATIRSHFTDSRGNEWLCTFAGLYKRDRRSPRFSKYDLSTITGSNAASNMISNVYEGKYGLWMLTDNGLYLYNYKTGKSERHGYDKQAGDVFLSQDINSFYEDPEGIAWVGTWQGGLSRYDLQTKKIKTYTQDDGLPSMCVQSIVADPKNNSLWLSTFDGLSRFDLKTGQFNNFSIADGIQGQLFADGSFAKTSGGLFAFGGSNGITIFNPNEIVLNSIPPKVFLTDLRISNKPVVPGAKSILKKPIYETSEITLPYNQNTLSIEFIALHYSNPAKNKYSYKLDNYDNEWREVGNQHVAFYPRLSPGEYVFHVKAANDKGVWNETGASLKIIINPPWWRTTWAYFLYAVLLLCIVFGINRYVHKRIIEKEREKNRVRELQQAREIEKAYYKLEEAHEALKATQSQLVQSEKMASLGQLTAGIAHEIQNPLNFVNNFSEVNTDLIKELKNERSKSREQRDDAVQDEIIHNLEDNEEKIVLHGRRADAIVKGMLQHSRISSGQKDPTDINNLADEYLRLSYHGMRAKDKTFSGTFETNFDESIGKINVIPQDIGRVLLNLYNNAFYAVSERRRAEGENYKPVVRVTTKAVDSSSLDGAFGKHSPAEEREVEIRISDNGPGIPQNILDKIFQPFFTTKPAGRGTGLGLSLSYDIVRAHGGEIKVETKENNGSEFIIRLPA